MQSKDVKNATSLRHTTCSCENLRVEHISQAILFWAIRPPQYKVAEPTGVTMGYREDQSPSMPAASFLSATLQSKFENIGLIETQCSILIPGSPWTYHGNCQGETNSNYHDARVQHLHSRMLRASWSCKHRAWHTWAIWVLHFDCPCFAHSLTNNHRFWMHFPSFSYHHLDIP